MNTDVIAAKYNMTIIEVRTLITRSGVSQMPVIKIEFNKKEREIQYAWQ
ncbi:MAG: hypothetical protein NUV44_05605 [Candidatus Scalindua sp.]|nr:hypothetical protein [Candidatus Scalindua sp.]